MDLVSYLEWLYCQDLVKIHHGQLPFLGLRFMESVRSSKHLYRKTPELIPYAQKLFLR